MSIWFEELKELTLREKPCFPSPGISWKAQKDQVNIIFPSTFWLKKGRISHHWKVQNKNFSVISKYHISINFLAQKYHIFHLQKIQNKNFLVISKHDIPSQRKYHLVVAFFLCRSKAPSSSFLRLSKFRKYYGKVISVLTYCVEKDFFCFQRSITSTFPSS